MLVIGAFLYIDVDSMNPNPNPPDDLFRHPNYSSLLQSLVQ
jgi:hypothetical protein